MHPVLQKTFGGLSTQYYWRQFFFGAFLGVFPILLPYLGGHSAPIGVYFFTIISTLLYPYSRFVYESIISFIMGETVFFVNVRLMLFSKISTMIACWLFAIFIAPIGLAYLYFHHSRVEQS